MQSLIGGKERRRFAVAGVGEECGGKDLDADEEEIERNRGVVAVFGVFGVSIPSPVFLNRFNNEYLDLNLLAAGRHGDASRHVSALSFRSRSTSRRKRWI